MRPFERSIDSLFSVIGGKRIDDILQMMKD